MLSVAHPLATSALHIAVSLRTYCRHLPAIRPSLIYLLFILLAVNQP